jgi:IclR family transcriptional regulator, acetate operon repressor
MSAVQSRSTDKTRPTARRAARGVAPPEAANIGSRALTRMLGIFRTIVQFPDGLSLAELSQRLETPKSSLLTLLRPLVASDHLVHVNGRYTLSNESFVLAIGILSARKLGTILRGLLAEAQRRCPETIIFATINRSTKTVTYSDVLESPQFIRYSIPAGTVRPLYTSAAGQLLLAYQDEKWREEYLRRVNLVPLSSRTITDRDILRRKLDNIARSALSESVSEAIEGVTGIAAPVFSADGGLIGALLIAGPTERYWHDGGVWKVVATDVASRASKVIGNSPAGI